MKDPESLLAAFARDGWDSKPFERMIQMVDGDGSQAAQLVSLAIQRAGKSATFIDAAISFIPEFRLPRLAREAVEALERDRSNPVAQSAIAYLSLQNVKSLRPYLLRFFFELTPNANSYYANWPWRGAADEELQELLAYLADANTSEERLRAARCVLESRRWGMIAEGLGALEEGDLPHPETSYLQEVGLERPDRVLFRDRVLHIRFPMSYLDLVSRPPWLSHANHPTWALQPGPGSCRFGGGADGECGVCGQGLHNLLSLDPVPEDLSISSVPRLQVATCLSCLGWSRELLSFRHGTDGSPTPLDTDRAEPEFPAEPLREVQVQLAKTPGRWQWQDWELTNSRENLNRLGGHPTWIQSADYPACPVCRRTMPFLMQFDSDLPNESAEEWLWGSGGICYVFWCDACAVSSSLWQCT